jgi:hypothetical protein
MTAGFCAARSRLRRLNAGIYVDEAFKLLSTTKIEVCVVTAGFFAARSRLGRLNAGIYVVEAFKLHKTK